MWRSAEVQCIDLRNHARDDLAGQLEAAAQAAIATGCAQLVIELGGLDELATLAVLQRVGEWMRAGGGEVTVRRSRAGPDAPLPRKGAASLAIGAVIRVIR